jgi:replicative DNA helicase
MKSNDKVQPQAPQLEKAVIGTILIDRDAFDRVSGILTSDCFYGPNNQRIFKAMETLAKKNMPVDILTVTQALITSNEIDLVGGPVAITRFTNGIVSSLNIETHAKIVFQKFLAREVIRVTAELHNMAYDDAQDAFDLMDYAEKSIGEIGSKNQGEGMVGMGKVTIEILTQIEKWRKIEGVITGIPSGFYDLDRATRGWQPGDLILLGARPSAGKTAFALQIARKAASKERSVAIWSLEMKASLLALRMLSTESGISLYKLQTGSLTDQEMKFIYDNAAKVLSEQNIFFDEKTNVTIQSIKRKARRLKKKNNLGLILIDYLQLMKGDDDKGNREREIATISRELKNLAQELDIPIIALSQLSRAEGAKNISWQHGPPPNSLRESGALEQDADLILMLWGPGDEDVSQDPTLDGKRKIRIVKHRNGVLITEELEFKNEIQFFQAVQQNYQPQPDRKFQSRKPYSEDKDEEPPF